MDPAALVLVLGTIAATALAVGITTHRARARAWREAAHELGLSDLHVQRGLAWETSLTGRSGDLQVTMRSYTRSKEDHGTRVSISGLGLGRTQIEVRREGFGAVVEKLFGESEIDTGDEAFDARAYIQGQPDSVHALLSADGRARLGPLLQSRIAVDGGSSIRARVSLRDGELTAELPGFSPKRLPEVLRRLLGCARALRCPESIPERLAENARKDPVPEVRLANLEALVHDHAGHPATSAMLAAALDDPAPAIRLRAAKTLGEGGRETLEALVDDPATPEPVATEAVDVLAGRMLPDRAVRILERALEQGQRALARSALVALARSRASGVVDVVARVLTHESNDLAVEAAMTLGRIGDASSEPALVETLGSDSSVRRRAAVAALRRVGTVHSVAPLQALASSYPLDRRLARGVRTAVAAIQSRVAGAGAGQVALVTPVDGALSLPVDDSSGQVSLSEGSAASRKTVDEG